MEFIIENIVKNPYVSFVGSLASIIGLVYALFQIETIKKSYSINSKKKLNNSIDNSHIEQTNIDEVKGDFNSKVKMNGR